MAADPSTKTYEVGNEVLLSGPNALEGVIKYIGEVDFAEGTMYGIELASQFSGKHDGKGYFECEGNRGIFVTVDRIRRALTDKDRTRSLNQQDFLADKPMTINKTSGDDEPPPHKAGPTEIGSNRDYFGGDDEYKDEPAVQRASQSGSFLEQKNAYQPATEEQPVPRKAGPRDEAAATELPAVEEPTSQQSASGSSAVEEKEAELADDPLPPAGPIADLSEEDYDKYVQIASALTPEQWAQVLSQLDLLERRRVFALLRKNKALAEGSQDVPEDWETALKFLLDKMQRVDTAVKAQGKRVRKVQARVMNMEPPPPAPADSDDDDDDEDFPDDSGPAGTRLDDDEEVKEADPPAKAKPAEPKQGGRGRGGKAAGRGGRGGRGGGRGKDAGRGRGKSRGGGKATTAARGGRGARGRGKTDAAPARGGKGRGGRGKAAPARGGAKRGGAARGGRGGGRGAAKSPRQSGRGRGRGRGAPAEGGAKQRPTREVVEEKESMPVTEIDPQRRRNYRFGARNINMLLPSEGYPARKDAKGPVDGALMLTHIHGYSGNKSDSRQNLYVSQDGNFLIYYIAAVCVVKNLAENTQQFFTLHNDDITTICLDPREGSTLVASGQKDPKDIPGEGKDLPKIWIWDYATMRKVKLINNVCPRSIKRLQWSSASGLLYCLCGDDDQTMKIYDSDGFGVRGPIEPVYSAPFTKEEVLGFVLSPQPNGDDGYIDEIAVFTKRKVLYCGVKRNNGEIKLRLKGVPTGNLNRDGEKAFTSATFIGTSQYLVGGASGNVYLCEQLRAVGMQKIHEKAIGGLIFTGTEVISAGADKCIRRFEPTGDGAHPLNETFVAPDISIPGSDFVFNPRCIGLAGNGSLYVGTRSNQVLEFELDSQNARIVVDGHDGQVWGLCCHPSDPVYVTAGWDRAIKVWKTESRECVATYEFENDSKSDPWQLIQAAWSPQGDIFAVGSTDSRIAIMRYEPLEVLCVETIPPKTANAEIEAISYLRFSPDGSRLGVAHMDSQAYIFDVVRNGDGVSLEKWRPINHTGGAPTHLQFSSDGLMIKTFTRDYEIVHWNLKPERRVAVFNPNVADPDVVTWADDPLIAGWDVEGLYQSGWDGTDLNDCAVTSDKTLVASGDDYGIVRLHNYPATVPEANRMYTGHAEFVVGVEWLCDDSFLITCGGADMAIFQWQLVRE